MKYLLTDERRLDTQGFFYAIAAAALYTVCSMVLMVNMLGYFLGHYPESFALSDSQRTLILQSMAFFVWLAGGAAVFYRIENEDGSAGWSYPDALYFCDVTILTVGFGDLVPTTDVGRGIVFPYSVGGIITLALIVSSLYKAVREIGEEKVIQKHVDRMREKALERTVTNSFDFRHREHSHSMRKRTLGFPRISAPSDPRPMHTAMNASTQRSILPDALKINRKPKIMLLKEEKDRFDAMRQIQADSKKFRRWVALFWSVTTFSVLWCVGAVIFWQAEKVTQDLTYFQALYFCYISLLTIGYGDLAPKSNAGRCFFVIWSLIAVPTMTILVSDLGDTVVAKFKKWSDQLADFTVLPKEGQYSISVMHEQTSNRLVGIWRSFLEKHPWLLAWLQRRISSHQAKKRVRKGFDIADPRSDIVTPTSTSPNREDEPEDPDEELVQHPTITSLAAEAEADIAALPSHASLSRRLALSIKKISLDFRLPKPKRYTYEEWVEFTRIIRATTPRRLDRDLGTTLSHTETENDEGLVNWDWIGNDSPMMSGLTESEWLLERLCESLVRLEKRKEVACDMGILGSMRNMEGKADDECEKVERGAEKDGERSPE